MPGIETPMTNLGPRVKTTMELPTVLVARMNEICSDLGIPRNAWITMGAAELTMRMLPLIDPGKKRTRIFKDLKRLLSKLLDEIESTL